MRRGIAALILLLGTCGLAAGQADVVGRASVIDGDTIEIHGQSIRLHGIDAPESTQLCQIDGQQYRCGQRAALALDDRIGAATVSCEPKDIDQYGRVVAVCSAGGEDLNAWMVRQGWALAYREYSDAYLAEERAAQAAGVGIWRGTFQPPWAWRRAQQQAQAPVDSGGNGCLIKGNVSRSGERIYHVPGQQHYDETRITEAKGERWFCSEAEAQSAGWRKAKR